MSDDATVLEFRQLGEVDVGREGERGAEEPFFVAGD